jgi:membrane protein YqaA with SNARE-associated domain
MGDFIARVSARAAALATTFGAPGLFLVAFLDSSFLSLPEISDLLVVTMVTHHKARALLYIVAATLGSLAGCLVIYYIGHKGGEAVVHKRFTPHTVERTMNSLRRHGIMAVLVPSLLPPPMPFKVFVFLAGGAGISVGKFIAAVLIGRGIRFLVLGVLAIQYGERVLKYMHENALMVSLAAVGILLAGFAVFQLWTKAQARKNR